MLTKHRLSQTFLGAALLALGASAWVSAQQGGSGAVLLAIEGGIGPATSDYVGKGIRHAAERGAEIVVIEMDTPGGLDTAMREIIQAILASPVPVVSYVYPPGARAASAGTYILYASHVAAMAPATNTGAATPVAIGGAAPALPGTGTGDDAAPDAPAGDGDGGGETESDDGTGRPDADPAREPVPQPATASERKAVNDAVAYIRGLAEQRGRNADWAESAVRSGVSISAQAALEANVIDLVAEDLDDLLAQLDGRRVVAAGDEIVLQTAGLALERFEPDWRTRFLAVISNPTVAYMLMLLGIYGLVFEGYNPGAIVPGVVGAISLLLALFALQILPVNYAGLALMLLGIILMIAEFLVPSFGALGIGGIAAFVFGSVILIDTDVPGFGVSIPLIAMIATTASLALLGVIWFALRSRDRPVVSGTEELTATAATAIEAFESEGPVRVHGERWNARSGRPVAKGQRLRIKAVHGLSLEVEPLDDTHPTTNQQT